MKTRNKAENYSSQAIDNIFNALSAEELKRTEQKMLLAAKIEDGINRKKWKKSEFAEKIGKSPSEVSKWLSGTHNFTADTLWDIEMVLGIKLISIEEDKELTIKYQPLVFHVQSEVGAEIESVFDKMLDQSKPLHVPKITSISLQYKA